MQMQWPVPISTHMYSQSDDINQTLARVFQAMRAAESLKDDSLNKGNFYASHDALVERVDLPEFKQLITFIVQSLQETAMKANSQTWPPGKMSLQLQIMGCWFQIQNGMAFHDVHTHGNCSWSGVYYVQVDPEERRIAHKEMGEANGVTRFYGPYTQWQSGAYIDLGNAYLQKNTLDIAPKVGKLVLFPSYLPHMAMPYEGEQDRIIVSFNAQIHSSAGDSLFQYDAR